MNPMAMDDEERVHIYIPPDPAERVVGNSMMQDILVDKIFHSGLSSPAEDQ